MNSFIPNKIVTISDRDASWVTPAVKTALRRNKRIYKIWIRRGKNQRDRESTQLQTNKVVRQAKSKYLYDLSNKLKDPTNGQKVFWSSFKRLASKKKITNIPPLVENNTFVSCFKEKADILNTYFASQCRPRVTNGVLPNLFPRTDKLFCNVSVSEDDIINIINKLNSKKAHGFDGISIPMLCSIEASKPLCLIFRKCLSCGKFPAQWKRPNVQPVHKKGSRQEKKNYHPISLLPICGKVFEKVIVDALYPYLNENNLLSNNQSGFRPDDSTINQLLAITTEIYEAFEDYDENRGIFLDISKARYGTRVWFSN